MLLQDNRYDLRSPLFIQSNSKDQFGFQEGAKLFSMMATLKKVPHQLQELEGRHCTLRPRNVVDFFMSHKRPSPRNFLPR